MGFRIEIKVREGQGWGRRKGSHYWVESQGDQEIDFFTLPHSSSSVGSMSPNLILSGCHGMSLPHLVSNLNFRPSWLSTFQGEQYEECYGLNLNCPLWVYSLNSGVVLGCCGAFRRQSLGWLKCHSKQALEDHSLFLSSSCLSFLLRHDVSRCPPPYDPIAISSLSEKLKCLWNCEI